MTGKITARLIVGIVCACALVAVRANAQTTTTSSRTVKFEVVSVNGNQLVVKLPEGTREMTVPDTTRFTVDGKQLTVHDLKAGMAGDATITTTTTLTPVYVTEARNVKIMQAFGNSVIIRDAQGGFKLFTQEDVDKYHVQISRNGQPIELQQLKAQDTISATFITTKESSMTQQQVDAKLAPVGAAPAAAMTAPKMAAPSPAAAAPAPRMSPAAPAATTPAAPAERTLPKTASAWPLVGVVGLSFLALGALMTLARKRLNN